MSTNTTNVQEFASVKFKFYHNVKGVKVDSEIKGKFALITKNESYLIGFLDGSIEPQVFKINLNPKGVNFSDNINTRVLVVNPKLVERTRFEQHIGDRLLSFAKSYNKSYKIKQHQKQEEEKLKHLEKNMKSITETIIQTNKDVTELKDMTAKNMAELFNSMSKTKFGTNSVAEGTDDNKIDFLFSKEFPLYDYSFDKEFFSVGRNGNESLIIQPRKKSKKANTEAIKSFIEKDMGSKDLLNILENLSNSGFKYNLSFKNLYISSVAFIQISFVIKQKEFTQEVFDNLLGLQHDIDIAYLP